MIGATFTDGFALYGAYGPKSHYFYGSLKTSSQNPIENGMRVVLYAISGVAHRIGYEIEPILSFQSDFYIRVYFFVRKSPKSLAHHVKHVSYVRSQDLV
jgi:tRNA G26 N,N-dimethylase Trm1